MSAHDARAGLSAFRRCKGWTRKRLVRQSGLTFAEVSGIESGRANPSVAQLRAIADALGLPLLDTVELARDAAIAARPKTNNTPERIYA